MTLMSSSRRDFLKASALVSMGASTVPGFLATTARASQGAKSNDKILVVVQMLGGNDGLNTVIPHGMDGYANARRALRIPSGQIQKVTDVIGLHPSLGGMHKLMESGKLSILQGIGYPNPDRSHFRSMEIWETARTETGALETGWLGRALDAAPPATGGDLPALHVGSRGSMLAFKAKKAAVPSLESLEQYRLQVSGDDAAKRASRDAIDGVARLDRGDDPLLGFLRRSTLAAYDSSKRLESIATKPAGGTKYPNFNLAKRLELIAQIIKAGFGTRIYYTALDGFDTHANQAASHAGLLNELSDSIAAFHADLSAAGQADRVAILSFSEFGRRVAENASAGTDHGAAAPAFLVGPVAKSGLVGDHPKMDDLDDGDLKHHTDFRRIYATLLENWLGMPAEPVLGSGFSPLPLFKPTMS
jgi:uncharacterized protein (DUF1501 family)